MIGPDLFSRASGDDCNHDAAALPMTPEKRDIPFLMGTVKVTTMKRQQELTPEVFDQLLRWLSPEDRNAAGRRYEQVRSRLIKIFECRGCVAAEDLADETLNRVARKVAEIAKDYVGDPALYFYGVAEKVYLEYRRQVAVRQMPLPAEVAEEKVIPEQAEQRYTCLEGCMERLPGHNRELIMAYYSQHDDPRSKINSRKELSEQMGIGANALWIRVHRIREGLKKCVTECLRRKAS